MKARVYVAGAIEDPSFPDDMKARLEEALTKAAEIGRELRLSPDRFDPLRDAAIAALALPDLKQTGRVIRRPPGASPCDRSNRPLAFRDIR